MKKQRELEKNFIELESFKVLKFLNYKVLKDKENKGSLTSRQKNMLFNDEMYLKNITKHLKNLKKYFKKYQYGLDYLFN